NAEARRSLGPSGLGRAPTRVRSQIDLERREAVELRPAGLHRDRTTDRRRVLVGIAGRGLGRVELGPAVLPVTQELLDDRAAEVAAGAESVAVVVRQRVAVVEVEGLAVHHQPEADLV